MNKILKYSAWLLHSVAGVMALVVIILVITLMYGSFQELSVLQQALGLGQDENRQTAIAPVLVPAESAGAEGERAKIAPVAAKQELLILPTETGYLNVREEPSMKAALVGRVKPGEIYQYQKQDKDWYQISLFTGATGWVNGKYIKILK